MCIKIKEKSKYFAILYNSYLLIMVDHEPRRFDKIYTILSRYCHILFDTIVCLLNIKLYRIWRGQIKQGKLPKIVTKNIGEYVGGFIFLYLFELSGRCGVLCQFLLVYKKFIADLFVRSYAGFFRQVTKNKLKSVWALSMVRR